MRLSVIIVSYNAVSYLDKCLRSIQENRIPAMEVIVWDNDSPDREVEILERKYPEIKFIFNKQNLGFSKGNNRAVEYAIGEYILILNPDTEVSPNFFLSIINFAEHCPNLGALGVRMTDEVGGLWPESKRNTPNMMNSFARIFKVKFRNVKPYHANHIAEDEVAKVEVLSGACMLMKKQVYKKVGGFDERYFMYGEDVDLSYTLLQNGYDNYYLGNISIVHYKGECTLRDRKYLDRFYGSMKIFLQKYEKPRNRLFYYIALLGVKLKHTIELRKLKNS
ncbi:glycosyltransferase [Flavobacteriaceae bacterium Ap0902]|nr:glycosyltransferase [Flavobacteriaceae bacterium Ap0902]